MYGKYKKSHSKMYMPNTEYDGKDHETHPYLTFHSFFSDYECSWIIEEMSKQKLQKGTTIRSNGGLEKSSARNCDVGVLDDSDQFSWVYDRIMDSAFRSNIWHYDMFGMVDGVQYIEYSGDKNNPSYYNWHKDTGPGQYHRKLSFVALLTDPEEFSGGEIQLRTVGSSNLLTKKGSSDYFSINNPSSSNSRI